MSKHYALLSEYIGGLFHGWQEQNNAPTVQHEIRRAWLKVSGENTHFRGSSRTDAGVSSLGHVCDYYTDSTIPYERIPLILNGVLPQGISIKNIVEVDADFDARYHSIGKLYVYNLWHDSLRSAIYKDYVVHSPQRLNLRKMQEAAKELEGIHDFTAFMDQGSVVRRTVRQIDRILVMQHNSPLISIICLGRGFLYHQVRIIAGTLWYIGQEKLFLEEMLLAMKNKDRKQLGKTMPPQGLVLHKVFYPKQVFGKDGQEDYDNLVRSEEGDWCKICHFP